jgi:hypothetical protein
MKEYMLLVLMQSPHPQLNWLCCRHRHVLLLLLLLLLLACCKLNTALTAA